MISTDRFSRLLVLQNADFEGPGSILDWAHSRQIDTRIIHAYSEPGESALTLRDEEAVIALGSPTGDGEAWVARESAFLARAVHDERHVLGICFGAQLLAQLLGAETRLAPHREIGWHAVDFAGESIELFQWHRGIFDVPPSAIRLAASEATACQAFRFGSRTLGFTGHPEITPELVEAFIARAWTDDPNAGRFVQSPAEMRRDVAIRARKSADFFGRTLDAWRAT